MNRVEEYKQSKKPPSETTPDSAKPPSLPTHKVQYVRKQPEQISTTFTECIPTSTQKLDPIEIDTTQNEPKIKTDEYLPIKNNEAIDVHFEEA